MATFPFRTQQAKMQHIPAAAIAENHLAAADFFAETEFFKELNARRRCTRAG